LSRLGRVELRKKKKAVKNHENWTQMNESNTKKIPIVSNYILR
jgi:hypothetical protein